MKKRTLDPCAGISQLRQNIKLGLDIYKLTYFSDETMLYTYSKE